MKKMAKRGQNQVLFILLVSSIVPIFPNPLYKELLGAKEYTTFWNWLINQPPKCQSGASPYFTNGKWECVWNDMI